MITVQSERIADVLDAAKPLVEMHFREVAHYQDIPLDPDWEFYRASKTLRCFTVRTDGSLSGYAVFSVARNKHYMGSLQAAQDILFVDPRDRGGVGRQLVRECDAALKEQGVQVVYHHQKIALPALGEVLRSEGYEPVEIIWAKRLDKE